MDTEYHKARENAEVLVGHLENLVAAASRLSAAINMRFLYDADRRLFGVGYAVGGPVEFSSHYDLLGSECRLASLVSIAKGDVPVDHWYALGRPRISLPGGPVLLSWSGTMFEYLMPLLFMRTFANSLLDHACREAVRQQIAYGNEKDVPWGISECAYGALDANQIYQYRAFGVPSLALKPGLEDDLVVAPYATMLALQIDPAAAVDNLKRLRDMDFEGPMGLYESIDFNLENTRNGQRGVVIYAYMAHHQGMSFAALDDILHHDVMVERFHGDVRVRAMESLLFERIPITRPPAESIELRSAPIRSNREEEPADRLWREDTATPRVHLQGNGRYALMVTNSGGSHSRWNEFDVTRWRSDPTLDRWGSFVYIRDMRSDAVWSAALQPLGGAPNTTMVRFSADRAEFTRRIFGIETIMDVTVADDDDAELRRLTITNRSLRSRPLEFTKLRGTRAGPASHRFVSSRVCEDVRRNRVSRTRSASGTAASARSGRSSHLGRPCPYRRDRHHREYATDRSQFLGRSNNVSKAPEALCGASFRVPPVRCLIQIFQLAMPRNPESSPEGIELTFVTLAAGSREALLTLIAKYQRPEAVARAFGVDPGHALNSSFDIWASGPPAAHRFQELASHLLYPNARMPSAREHTGPQPTGAGRSMGIWDLRRSPDSGCHGGRCPSSSAGSGTAGGTDLLAMARIPRGFDHS